VLTGTPSTRELEMRPDPSAAAFTGADDLAAPAPKPGDAGKGASPRDN
jgi:hypothetical protein